MKPDEGTRYSEAPVLFRRYIKHLQALLNVMVHFPQILMENQREGLPENLPLTTPDDLRLAVYFEWSPCHTDTVHLQTPIPSPRYEPDSKDKAIKSTSFILYSGPSNHKRLTSRNIWFTNKLSE